MSFYISLGVTFEIFFIILAASSEIRRYISCLAAAYAYSAVLVLAILSVSIQFFFLFGIHKFYPVVDLLLIVISICLLYRNRQILFTSYKSLKEFCANNPFFAFSITLFPACLFIKGFLLPPATIDSMVYHLARILMMQNDGDYFLKNFADYRQDIMPIGYDILHFLYLRFYTDYGLATFGFLSYTIVLTGIFSLVKKLFSDNQLSKIICFISASLPMFLTNATSTKNDLILASIAIVCFLSAYNYIQNRNCIHLYVLIVALFFGLDTKFTFGGFFLPFLFFYTIFVFKQSGVKSFGPSITINHFNRFLFFILPLSIIFFILTLLIHNYMKYGAIIGPDFYLAFLSGKDSFWGSSVNVVRYFFQTIDLPIEAGGKILNTFCDLILGEYKSIGLFPGIHSVQVAGSIYYLEDITAWYGLLGMPIMISIMFTVFRGKGFLRVVALSIVIFAIIISIQIPWSPWNGRYFAPVFAGGMACFAFLLNWISYKFNHASKYIMGGLLLIAGFYSFFQVIYLNINYMSLNKYSIKNRNSVHSQYYPERATDFFLNKIQPGSSVLLICPTNYPIAPLFFLRPDLNITITGEFLDDLYREPFRLKGKNYNLLKLNGKEFKTIQKKFDNIIKFNS